MKYLGKFSGKVYSNKSEMQECGLQISDEQANDEEFLQSQHIKDLLICITCFGCPKSNG